MKRGTPFPFGLFMSRGDSATEPTVTEIYLCMQEEVRNPTRGVFLVECYRQNPKIFYTPLPPLLNFAHRVGKTLCMYVGSPL